MRFIAPVNFTRIPDIHSTTYGLTHYAEYYNLHDCFLVSVLYGLMRLSGFRIFNE